MKPASAAGADRIKLIATGIIDFSKGAVTAEPQMTTEEIHALVAAAQSFGKQTLAHASGDAGIDRTIEGGVDTIEHGYFLRDDQLAPMRDRNIAWVPTFAPVQAQLDNADLLGHDATIVSNLKRILDQHAATLLKAHQLGVTVLAGSDAGSYGVPHGLGLLYEMSLMERAGLTPLAVLNAATGVPSQRLAFKDSFGQIRPGFRARFILTEHSPLDSVIESAKVQHHHLRHRDRRFRRSARYHRPLRPFGSQLPAPGSRLLAPSCAQTVEGAGPLAGSCPFFRFIEDLASAT